ncbi:MAG: hypothetical protein EXR99_07940 [Gemmataceae bacterium]|nr:hypothetical protein [Gemmataceae bacterium]
MGVNQRVLPLLFLAGIVLPGCGGGVGLYPVKGKVTFQGQPAEGATVVFHRIGQDNGKEEKPRGTVNAQGEFMLATHPHGDGAPSGEYKVLVVWFPPNARSISNPMNKLPDRYALFESTPITAKVKEENNTLEAFNLSR